MSRSVHLGFEVVKSVVDLVMCQDNARHLDIDAAWKAVQRNLRHRCLRAAAKPKGWLGTGSATALGPTSGRVAVLGRNALGNRATALGPASKISAQVLQAILSRIASITTASFLRGQRLA